MLVVLLRATFGVGACKSSVCAGDPAQPRRAWSM